MKRGKKFLNMRNRKLIRTMLIGISVLVIAVVVLWTISKKQNNTVISQYDNLLDRRYVQVDLADFGGHFSVPYSLHFDLKNKEYFGVDYAIKGKKSYGQTAWSNSELYNGELKAALTSAIFNLKLSKQDIQDNNFTIVRKVYPLLDKQESNKEYPPDLENDYNLHNLTKIRITYNKDYLPILLKGYYGDENGEFWKNIRRFSYPYDSKEEFDKALDDAIDWIEISESEMEED